VSKIQRLEHLPLSLEDRELNARGEVETELEAGEGWDFNC
jgi:hypothetical protein